MYTSRYRSPLGSMVLAADDTCLTGLWFENQKYFPDLPESQEKEIPLFAAVKHWLDLYFSGTEPDFSIPLGLSGTDFQRAVWKILCEIPYGQTTTYGEIAKRIARERGIKSMSAQAVGGAVGRNPVSIVVPCHRVVGADGSLTGYAGGTERKKRLLLLERGSLSDSQKIWLSGC